MIALLVPRTIRFYAVGFTTRTGSSGSFGMRPHVVNIAQKGSVASLTAKHRDLSLRRQHWTAALVGLSLLWGGIHCPAQNQTPNSQEPAGKNRTHISPKDDIEAIGSRNIGKTGPGNWYSLEREEQIGREYAKAIDQTTRLMRDPVVNAYVKEVAQKIVRNSDAKVAFTIKVIDSEEVNAFALPGGFLYVNTGLLLATQDEAELAAVMAHEIAHVAARHATRQLTRKKMFDFASIPLVLIGGPVGMAVQTAMGVTKPLGFSKFTRSFEAEADYLGVQYMYKAGYDPQALISFFERMQAMQRRKAGVVAKAFSTHPETRDRIAKLQKELANILPPRDLYEVSTSDFDDVIAHLLKVNQTTSPTRDSPRPTLHRRTSITSAPQPD